MKNMRNKRTNKPVNINKDVWFYVNSRSYDFVVWTPKIDGKRQSVQFRVPLKKLETLLLNPRPNKQ